MILAGPFEPKLKAEALVTSEKVGEGGPGEADLRGEAKAKRRGREGISIG
jgi:hypothetical protein